MKVRTGLERLLANEGPTMSGRKVGLLANPTSVDTQLVHSIDRMCDAGIALRALFGPEHGLRGDAQDMVSVDQALDSRTGVPVYSLYGHDARSLAPKREELTDIDVLIFDIQDVGARYYTYVWTMVLAMRACAEAGVAMVVLDRPNPLGGDVVEGGAIATGFDSFVGLVSVPNRHGMTAGELATMVRANESLDIDLTVVTMDGWRRDMSYEDTGLPWVMPSPNMPTVDTAWVYPGMCLVEGTELSEGRGTTRPFELAGAPFVEGHVLAEALADEGLPGVVFRPVVFTPMFQKHAKSACGGVQLHVTDRSSYRSYLTGVAFVRAVFNLWPEKFAWRKRAYEFVEAVPAFDLLCGSAEVRQGICAGARLEELVDTWSDAEREFRAAREPWLLYE